MRRGLGRTTSWRCVTGIEADNDQQHCGWNHSHSAPRPNAGASGGHQHTPVSTDLAAYYAARAAEYERVYEKAERQADLRSLRTRVAEYFLARSVLEIACGTGYWTTEIAKTALTVTATDASPEVLQLAEAKSSLKQPTVTLMLGDAFDLPGIPGRFDAGFAGFWWSHVPRERMSAFLDGLHRRLGTGARMMFIDNRYVEENSTPISRRDAAGNTYQQRTLSTGLTYEVLKNFPEEWELRHHLVRAADLEIVALNYYWYVTYLVDAA